MEELEGILKAGQEGELLPCELTIDEEGDWYHNGQKVIREEFVRFFYQCLDTLPDGRYVLKWKDQVCTLEVKDTPYVVWSVDMEDGAIRLFLSDWSWEVLDPATLWIGKSGIPYCKVKGGRFLCRFSRKAFYQLAEFIQEGEEGFHLVIGHKSFPLTQGEMEVKNSSDRGVEQSGSLSGS